MVGRGRPGGPLNMDRTGGRIWPDRVWPDAYGTNGGGMANGFDVPNFNRTTLKTRVKYLLFSKVMSTCALADSALKSAIGLPKAKHRNHENPSNRVLVFCDVTVTTFLSTCRLFTGDGENIFIESGMLEMGLLMSLQTLNHPPFLTGDTFRKRTQTRCRAKSNLSTGLQLSSEDNGKYAEPGSSLMRCESSGSLISQPNTVGVIGGVSVLSTLIFLEKLACWGSRNGRECPPFVVSSDSVLSKVLSFRGPLPSARSRIDRIKLNQDLVIENLRCKRNFLQQSGAQGLAMPCHLSHAWHSEISEDSSLPFLHVGDCVAMELKNAKLKPMHAAYTVRIGLLTTDSAFVASYYQEKLQSQGFEVVLLDKATEEHVLVPAMEALYRKDIEGARNLLRIAIHVLLVRAVNLVLLASDDLLGVLPHNDPLLRKCIDPMDALARNNGKRAQEIIVPLLPKACHSDWLISVKRTRKHGFM
ncbi:hypothetical protein V8G54_015732 [Vigna mungo]|uniref:Uncharacterized protein n=1 Tax=Vigna mungo TaxID=3915 RepID=A0AAQ3NKU5_VIGMU